MSQREEKNFFTHQIDAVSQRTQELYNNASQLPWQEPERLAGCLEDLRLALEELHVAEEQLRQQNQHLALAKLSLEAERKRYHDLFKFAPDGYLVTDMHGIVQEANRAIAILLNSCPQYLIGQPIVSFIPSENRAAFWKLLKQVATIHRVQEWEIHLCRQGDGQFEAALTVETVRDNQLQTIGLRWLVRDIGDRKQAEAQLQQLQLQNLEQIETERLRQQFVNIISHELRTPLNAIMGFSQLVLQHLLQRQDAQLVSMVDRVIKNSRHLLSLIEAMLNFSQLQTQRLMLQPVTFDLVELLATTVMDLRPVANQKGLVLEIQHHQDRLLVMNDRSRLRQVLVNLLVNAIKFTEVGYISTEILELPEGRVAIIVHDTGIGIDPVDQSKIFQEFWQVNQTTTRFYGGMGLGLAITRAIVKLMKGSISVESQPNCGSSFRVELPRWLVSEEHN